MDQSGTDTFSSGGDIGTILLGGEQGFFKADLLPFKEAPRRVAGDGDAAFAQFIAHGVKRQIGHLIEATANGMDRRCSP